MAKKKNRSTTKKKSTTLEEIQAMSDSDNDDDMELNSKAMNLKKAIESGQFDKLLEQKVSSSDDDDEMEEIVMDSDDESGGGDDDDDEPQKKQEREVAADDDDDDDDDDEDEDEQDKEEEQETEDEPLDDSEEAKKAREFLAGGDSKAENDDDDDDSDSDSEDERTSGINHRNTLSSKAMDVVTQELKAQKQGMPWPETFDVMSKEALPFSEDSMDIHDDLKREVVFYNVALDAAKMARSKCREAKIPFSRPDDFFVEMVKTDEHMARIKDRLIFEGKKIEAVAQRKSNKEQKLRSKESHANKLAEKAKRKKEHFREVDDWAKSAAQNRGGVLEDDADSGYLNRMGRGGVSKKRQAADKKYGFGGKRGRFKQNDRATLNDTSSFNPRGNFGGMGTKKTSSGSGAGRQGKRARDASRARR